MLPMQTESPTDRSRIAFTLVELLVAMAVTLLLMAALGKAFATIGKTMKEGRSKVTLSSKLRGVSFRLRTDIRTRTIEARPPIEQESGRGYLTYYEGPLTEHTWGLYCADAFRKTDAGEKIASNSPQFGALAKSSTYRRHSRFGDIDDYIAFTAEAPGDEWFTGKVPAYLVDDTATDPMEPRVIRSKFAEIIIWASPRWDVDPATSSLITTGTPTPPPDVTRGMPAYVDGNRDLIPDHVSLHQRVLLIRPDLNVSGTIPGASTLLTFDSDFLRPIGGTGGPGNVPTPLQRIYPIGNTIGPYYSGYVDPASGTDPTAMLRSHWLVGMAPLHHFYDLSLRRIVHPVTGEPTGYVAANSLKDLVDPHNRFAHVRYPGRFFGRGSFASNTDYATSMPLLAMAWNDAILTWNANDPRDPTAGAAPAWFPTAYPHPNTINLVSGTRSTLFNGWLLPHFELGNPATRPAAPLLPDTSDWLRGYLATPDPRWDRTGEDVIATNVLSFDIKGFDTNAPVFLTSGLDGEPGQAGVNDDGFGGATDAIDQTYVFGAIPNAQVASELGAVGSDDVLVRTSDLGIAPLMQTTILDPRNANTYLPGYPGSVSGRHRQMLASSGDFVDLLYPYLAGGAMQNLTATTPGSVATNLADFCASDLSGYPLGPGPSTTTTIFPLRRSGKMVYHGPTNASISFIQPCYDTWTDGYESDGFDQTSTVDGGVTSTDNYGSVWVLSDPIVAGSVVTRRPRWPNPAAPAQPFSVDTGRYDSARPESSPPFAGTLPAISMSVRVADPSTQEIAEMTIVQDLLD